MKRIFIALLAASAASVAAQPASAAITWTDWTSANGSQVNGTAGSVSVTYSGGYYFAQTAPGTDYYTGTAFPTSPINYKPSNTDIIALGAGGTKTITFSQPVTGLYLALVSWNIPGTVTFDHSFTTVVNGCGPYGCGTLPASGTSFPGSGEIHGVIKFAGPLSSLTFTDTSEYWHGITVGFDSVAGVPEPASWAMMIGGFAFAGAALRRRRGATSVRYA